MEAVRPSGHLIAVSASGLGGDQALSGQIELTIMDQDRHRRPASGSARPGARLAEALFDGGQTVPDHQQDWTYFLDILRDTLSAG